MEQNTSEFYSYFIVWLLINVDVNVLSLEWLSGTVVDNQVFLNFYMIVQLKDTKHQVQEDLGSKIRNFLHNFINSFFFFTNSKGLMIDDSLSCN